MDLALDLHMLNCWHRTNVQSSNSPVLPQGSGMGIGSGGSLYCCPRPHWGLIHLLVDWPVPGSPCLPPAPKGLPAVQWGLTVHSSSCSCCQQRGPGKASPPAPLPSMPSQHPYGTFAVAIAQPAHALDAWGLFFSHKEGGGQQCEMAWQAGARQAWALCPHWSSQPNHISSVHYS